jgi:predicted nuclease of predicted toxin-antitoxin system
VRLKLDENIGRSSVAILTTLGHDVDTVLDEGLGGRSDADVWHAARHEARPLVTQDLDFSDERLFGPGDHPGLFVVRLPDSEQWRVADYLAAWFSMLDAPSWSGCLVIATTTKLRVRRARTP